ncbi:nuclear formin-like protein [Plasmodium gaboni]|uniref:Nuclear formin-like protein n=1 Tax=Plasmodium gaboni TaxID=647221 RepID=A0A151L9M0_9APIC|nr:nuclear formin-like protein [Plasmodium gaboni]KYN95648.1 nuclear formin-like protein [Plasmodium gaboni]
MAPDRLLNKYIFKFQKINDKLLELVNKYRYAYFKAVDVINNYEDLVKRNSNLFDDKELSDIYNKKRQCEECILEDEIEIRKKLHIEKDNNIVSNNYIKDYNIKNENELVLMKEEPVLNIKDNNHMINNNESCISDINEKNKSNYVDLGALDFSAYKEDAEGCIQYYENKENIQAQKESRTEEVEKKRDMKINSSRYGNQHVIKNRNILKQSIYAKQNNNNMKSVSGSKYIPNKSVISIDKSFKITQNRNIQNLNKKSVYNNNNINNNNNNNNNNMLNKMSVGGINKNVVEKKMDIHKSTYIGSNNKLLNNMNRSIYIGAKKNTITNASNNNINNNNNNNNINNSGNIYNNSHNYKNPYDNNISLLSTYKNTGTINKEKKMNDTSSNKNVTNSYIQNSLYIKKGKSFNVSNNSVYVNKNICQDSIYNKSNTIIYNRKKRKTNENEKEENKRANKNKEYDEDNNCDEKNKNNKLNNNNNNNNNNIINKEMNKTSINNDISKNISILYDYSKFCIPITLDHIKNLIEYDDKDCEFINTYPGDNISELKNVDNTLEGINIQCDKTKCEKINEEVDTNKYIYSVYKGDNIKKELYIKEEKCIISNINNNRRDDKKSCITINKNLNIEDKDISSYSNGNKKNVCESNEQDEDLFVREKDKNNINMDNNNKINIDNNNNNINIDNNNNINIDNNNNNNNNINIHNNNKVDINEINCNNSYMPIEYTCENSSLQINKNNVECNDDNKLKLDEVATNKVIIKDTNDDISLKYKNIIFNINDEIKKKVNKEEKEEINEHVESLNILCNKPRNIKNVPFPSCLRKNILLKSGERKSEVNNRCHLNLDINVDVRYITLNMIDIDDTINNGVCPYKDMEDNYIYSEEHIKDIIKYSDILESEKKTFLYYRKDFEMNDKNDDNYNNIKNTLDNIIQFKSSNEIKNDIIKLVGISIFHCINESYEPTKSLMNDKNIEIWFTKKEKNKNKNEDIINNMRGNILELNYGEDKELILVKEKKKKIKIINKRLSSMGYFSQAVIIMLCSLKRQNEYKNLKKIITSIILCTCDSSCLEKFLHTIPEENSKNYVLWQETLNKLKVLFGENKCDEIVDRLMIIEEEDDNMNESVERGRLINNKYNNNHNNDEKDLSPFCRFDNDMHFFDDHINNLSFPFEGKEEKNKKYNNNEKEEEDKEYEEKDICEHDEIYEDEKFCLFICRIKNVHKRFGYLLLIESFDFVYEDLLKNIRNKLHSIELILNKHLLLKQLFCNILYICNCFNKPKKYEWFEWNMVVEKLKKLYGYSENGRISKERCIMLILAKHTGEIFTDKELYFLKKISTFYIKDLYDKCIDFINTYLEIKNEMDTEEFIDSCCIHNLKNNIKENNIYDNSSKYYVHDKFLEIVKKFVQKNYNKILYIIWNIVLMIKQYLVIIFWFNDIKPFFPLFNYINEDNKQNKSIQDFFVNFVHFFENYNKYIDILKKQNLNDNLKNTSNDIFYDTSNINMNISSSNNEHNNLRNNYDIYTNDKIYEHSIYNAETKKKKSLTNTIDYACLLKRKSAEHNEAKQICKQTNSGKFSDVEFELSD